MRWIKSFWRWLGGLFCKPRLKPQLASRCVDDVPDHVEPGTVYIVGENGHLWCVVLLCPCGCREVIQLSLLPAARPHWHVVLESGGTVTLSPSVWRVRGCRSHFFLRNGMIVWCHGEHVQHG